MPPSLALSWPGRSVALTVAALLGGLVACSGKITATAPGAPSGAESGAAAANGTGAGHGGSTSSGAGGNASGGDQSSAGDGTASGANGSGARGGSSTGGSGAGSSSVDCSSATHGAVAPVRRLTLSEYQNAVTDLFGVEAGGAYPSGSGKSLTGYSTEPDLLLVGEQGVGSIMDAAEAVALALPAKLASILPCAKQGDDACAATFLDTVGHRAFRRALTDDERQSLTEIYAAERQDGAAFGDAVAVMSAALLQMPQFLYVLEGDVKRGEDRSRTGPELALRLALQLWDSIPDDELLAAAEGGKLEDATGVKAQAERMLADPRSERGIRRFFREWSETSAVAVASKDRAAFPYLDDELETELNESFDWFVSDQVRGGGTLYSLLRSNKVFVKGKLADFFGVDATADYAPIELSADRYTGISTQPALLAALAHPVSPSYVFRGRFILTRLLCQDLGTPPANAQSEFGNLTLPENPTAKETAAGVEAKSACRGCHQVIDPGGLAFEHFDGLGHYREKYDSGKAIDTSGKLDGVTTEPIVFDGPVELMEQLAGLPETERCFATQLFRWSAAALDGAEDSCSIDALDRALASSDGTLAGALRETTQTDQFLYRRGE